MTSSVSSLSRIFSPLKALSAIAFACTAMLASAAPASAEPAATYMQRVANDLIAAQRSGSSSSFANALRKHMDVPGVGLTALGPHANSLPKAERPSYYSGMIKFVSNYAAKEAGKYPVANAIVIGKGEEDAKSASVQSRITLKSGETYDVTWKLMRVGQSWKVRDAEVAGFWMSPFLNNLFQTYISDNGNNPRALVVALNR
jgi:phospholipid transport system substrate-binding protein